jgi:hypothetical protein
VVPCPSCGRVEQVVRVQGLYESGVSVTRSVGRTSVQVHGSHGTQSAVGTIRACGTTRTSLSRSLRPPQRPLAAHNQGQAIGAALVVMFVTGIAINAVLGSAASWAGLAVAAWFLVAYRKRYRVAHPRWCRRWALWRRLFCCRHCDAVFLPAGEFPPPLGGRLVERRNLHAYLAECADARKA